MANALRSERQESQKLVAEARGAASTADHSSTNATPFSILSITTSAPASTGLSLNVRAGIWTCFPNCCRRMSPDMSQPEKALGKQWQADPGSPRPHRDVVRIPRSAQRASNVIIPLIASAPPPMAINRIPHAGNVVRDASGYPTAPNPTAKAAIAGRLKNGDGARDRFLRGMLNAVQHGENRQHQPADERAEKANTKNRHSDLIPFAPNELTREGSGSEILSEPSHRCWPCRACGRQVGAIHS